MVQINDDNYEDLTEDSMGAILDAFARGETPKPGPQVDRQTSCAEGGPTTLKKMAERNYDYRSQWSTATAGEGRAVKDVLKIVLAIVIVIVAWKFLKGIIGLAIGIALAGLVVYGGMKLLEGPR